MKSAIPILQQSDEQIMEIVRQLRVAYKLKTTLRYASERDSAVHSESVAEHVFALCFLAQYFLPLEDPDGILDIGRIYQIIIFHDFGEIKHGDVPYHLKTEEHINREREAAQEIFASLPESVGNVAYERWHEYEEQSSPEGRFVYALDKIEPMFELLDPINEQSLKRLKFSYEAHIGKKLKATENFPVMRKFVDVVSEDMINRGVFWTETPNT